MDAMCAKRRVKCKNTIVYTILGAFYIIKLSLVENSTNYIAGIIADYISQHLYYLYTSM